MPVASTTRSFAIVTACAAIACNTPAPPNAAVDLGSSHSSSIAVSAEWRHRLRRESRRGLGVVHRHGDAHVDPRGTPRQCAAACDRRQRFPGGVSHARSRSRPADDPLRQRCTRPATCMRSTPRREGSPCRRMSVRNPWACSRRATASVFVACSQDDTIVSLDASTLAVTASVPCRTSRGRSRGAATAPLSCSRIFSVPA